MNTELERAKKSAFSLLKFRVRSKDEISQRLRQKKFPQPIITEVLDFLTDLGYLDDLAFCLAWISDRQHLKPKSKRLITLELRKKGVAQEIISEAFDKAGIIDDEQLAYDIAVRKYEKLKSLKPDIAGNRLSGFLIRRGFSNSLTYKIVRGLIENDK